MNHPILLFALLQIFVVETVVSSHHSYHNRVIKFYRKPNSIREVPRIHTRDFSGTLIGEQIQPWHEKKLCDKFQICSTVRDYPEEAVRELVRRETSLNSFFGPAFVPYDRTITSRTRIKDTDKAVDGPCPSFTYTVTPKNMSDINGKPHVIINIEGDYDHQQNFMVDVCDRNGPVSRLTSDNCNDPSTRIHCTQNSHTIILATMNEISSKLEYNRFSVPSHCEAVYEKIQ